MEYLSSGLYLQYDWFYVHDDYGNLVYCKSSNQSMAKVILYINQDH